MILMKYVLKQLKLPSVSVSELSQHRANIYQVCLLVSAEFVIDLHFSSKE